MGWGLEGGSHTLHSARSLLTSEVRGEGRTLLCSCAGRGGPAGPLPWASHTRLRQHAPVSSEAARFAAPLWAAMPPPLPGSSLALPGYLQIRGGGHCSPWARCPLRASVGLTGDVVGAGSGASVCTGGHGGQGAWLWAGGFEDSASCLTGHSHSGEEVGDSPAKHKQRPKGRGCRWSLLRLGPAPSGAFPAAPLSLGSVLCMA